MNYRKQENSKMTQKTEAVTTAPSNLIKLLQSHVKPTKSVKTILQHMGVTKWSNLSEPLVNLSEEEVISLLILWIRMKLPRKEKVSIHIREEDTRDVYKIKLLRSARGIYVVKCRLRANYKSQHLTYKSLSIEKIRHSMLLAELLCT